MNIKRGTKLLEAKAEISLLDIKSDLVLFQIIVLIDGEESTKQTGICTKSEIKAINEKHQGFVSSLYNLRLFKAEIREALRENKANLFSEDYRIDASKVFDGEIDLDKTDYVIGNIDYSTENFYEYEKSVPYAKSIYFDYINANVDNSSYDLENMLSILMKRNDVTLQRSKYNSARIIQEIPYYNATDERSYYIAFEWHPTDEDWEKYYQSGKFEKTFDRYEYILSEIFGVKRLEIEA